MPVRAVIGHVGLACCVVIAVAACASPAARQSVAGAVPIHASGSRPPGEAKCPVGRLLPQGGVVMIEWVDFLQFDGRQYIAGLGPTVSIRPGDLGQVITHIRCSMTTLDDHRHIGFPLVDRSAAFIPAGTAVLAVRGYSPQCRLASYVGGQLHVYLAQREVNGHTAPRPCALLSTPPEN